MRKLSPRELSMLGLLGVVGASLFYFAPERGLGPSGGGGFGEDLQFGEAPVVRLDRLAGHTDGYDAEGRNLFQYYTPPPPVQHTPPPRPPPRPQVAPPAPPPVLNPSVVIGKPTPPPIHLSYLGFLGPKDNKIAVFEDGQELVLARRGEVVKQQFRVVDFGYETVVMGYVDERFKNETQELQQKPGAAGSAAGRTRGRR